MKRPSRSCGISVCGALLLLAPALIAAQDKQPAPAPKQDTVTVRAVGGTFELKGTSSPDSFLFIESCEPKQGYSESNVQLALTLEVEAGPDESLEHVTTLLRTAVAEGAEIDVEPSGEPGQVAMFYWSGEPRFRGVIASLGVKYTMFFEDGTPTRATVNLAMKQAKRLQSKEEANKPAAAKKKSDCSP